MAKDPYRYFRIEAQELTEGLSAGLVELEKGQDSDLVRRLLRQAHTLKGASRVVKRTDIADLSHAIEDCLTPHRETGGPVERETIDQALVLVDEIRELVATLGAPVPDDAEDGSEPSREREPTERSTDLQTMRVGVGDIDVVLDATIEASVAAAALQRETERLPRGPRTRAILDSVERLLVELDEVRTVASGMRLVPARTLTDALERVVRDAAATLDKEVEFRAVGVATHIDAHVLAGLRTALVHIVRNAVAHGIESPDVREGAGKTRRGLVELVIERFGHRVSVTCRDDGAGLDFDSLRAAAADRGLVELEDAEALDAEALGELLLRGGVSTTAAVTQISGRGVGLDAVRQAVTDLGGEVRLESTPGTGTSVEMLVPISLSTVPALSMQIDSVEVLVPLENVVRAVRFEPSDLTRDAEGKRLVVADAVVPYVEMASVLRLPSARRGDGRARNAVVVQAGGRRVAVGVARLGSTRSIVLRAVPEHVEADPVIAGATLGDAGIPQLVLAPDALVRLAQEPAMARAPAISRKPPPLLVIDDSLTTRMLEQSILESAGYEVSLAVSGEDALAKARERRYGLFIVDVEMPGMNGFEFIEIARNDPDLSDVPAILVTSRSDPDDKRRGKEVGARAYIVKSEFDQTKLLETVRRLVG